MITGIDHVGIAVRDLDAALRVYRDKLGFQVEKIYVHETEKVRTAVISSGDCRFELIQPVSEESPVAKFLARRGEGVNYVSLQVDNLDRALQEFKALGLTVLREAPTVAGGRRYSFLHPKDTMGVLFEVTGP